MQEIDLELKDLGQYYGTEMYHGVFLGVKATDGVAYVMKNGYSWFVTDAIAAAKTKPNIAKEEFLSIKLKLLGDNKGKMEISDGNDHILYTQDYNYTDAKKELDMYLIDNIILLSSEN